MLELIGTTDLECVKFQYGVYSLPCALVFALHTALATVDNFRVQ